MKKKFQEFFKVIRVEINLAKISQLFDSNKQKTFKILRL